MRKPQAFSFHHQFSLAHLSLCILFFAAGNFLGRTSTLVGEQQAPDVIVTASSSGYYPESAFVSLKEIEVELKKSDYYPTIECELCLIEAPFKGLLYVLGKYSNGPVLEEGSFCGCSTAIIATGLKDAAKIANRGVHPLITSDAFPVSPTSVKSPNQYREVNAQKYELYVWEKLVFTASTNIYDAMKRLMIPTIERDGSVLPCLMRTLYNNDIHDFVTVVAGSSNTAPNLNYRLIFTDATHNMEETLANEPVWSKHLFNGYPVIIAFHDVATCCPDVIKYILDKYKPTHHILTNDYFLMEVDGKPLA